MAKGNRIVKNTAMLYLMNLAKLIFPLLTLPYLTRVLSEEGYGVYYYVRSVLTYVQLIIDFGFLYSATRDIAQNRENKALVGEITGQVMVAKGILSGAALVVLLAMGAGIGMLRENPLYTLLSFVQALTTIFLVDFLFHGLEEMQVITVRYLITRAITVGSTFLLIHGDGDLILIPLLEIAGNLAAILWVWWEIRRMGIRVRVGSWRRAIAMLRESFVFFLSDMASTAFGALNTLIVGIVLTERDVAYWGVAMQFVSAVQMMYNPIMNSIYPPMVREKRFSLIKKVLLVFMPLIVLGCVVVFFGAEVLMSILGGEKYLAAAPLLRWFIPLLLVSFPSMLFGWPVLGAIGKTKETTATTIAAAVVQIVGLGVLLWTNHFTFFHLAILRAATDFLMLVLRMAVCWRGRHLFAQESRGKEAGV